jgi:hypothetical protein
MFEHRVPRRTFGPKGDEVTGGCRKFYNGELHNLFSSPNFIRVVKSRMLEWKGHVQCTKEMRNTYEYKNLYEMFKGRPRCRWKDNKTDRKEIRYKAVDCIHLTRDRVQWWGLENTAMNLRIS